ncbi:MAG: HD domain-containing protein [Bacteroidota bacterium]
MDYQAAKDYILQRLRKELSEDLYYHGLHHTLDVLRITKEVCRMEGVEHHQRILLQTAALYHDSGFVLHHKEHERLGCGICQEVLPGFGYTAADIEAICGMIMATKIPQSPQNELEEIICDADLDYLGRSDFFQIGQTLYKEFLAYGVVKDEEGWNRLQVSFLQNHHFFTSSTIERRQVKKNRHLEQLKKIVEGYKKNTT